jgi:diguanylate cyclase (GGDEF)-like protein
VASNRSKGSREIERLERQGLNIIGIFAGATPVSAAAAKAAERLRREHGDGIYADLLFAMIFRRFETGEAKHLWEEILHHKYLMSERLKRNVGMRVATMDYLLHYRRILRDARMIALQDLNEILVIANLDSLTGLYNHRVFYERAEEEVERARRGNRPLSLLMMDIDHFKKYNDTLGHLRGDFVLREAAQLLRDNIRPGDIACRYGGDEFAVLCPGASKSVAREVGERLRASAERARFYQEDAGGCQVTFSVGAATFPDDTDNYRGLVDLADGALYISKKRGRNRVTVF